MAVVGEDRHIEVGETLVAHFLQIFVVKPLALLKVELCAALRAVLEGEEVDELVDGKDFLVVAWIPAEQGKEINHSLRQIARLAVARRDFARFRVLPFQREHWEAEAVAVALRQLAFAVGLEQEWKVNKCRHRVSPAECFVEKHVERCRRQPLFAANHVGDLHQMVVDDVGKVVCWEVVGRFVEHLVVED